MCIFFSSAVETRDLGLEITRLQVSYITANTSVKSMLSRKHLVLERLQTIVDYIPQIARINSLRGSVAISLNRPIGEFGVEEPTLGRLHGSSSPDLTLIGASCQSCWSTNKKFD